MTSPTAWTSRKKARDELAHQHVASADELLLLLLRLRSARSFVTMEAGPMPG
jgi:hypothetical protein